MEFVGVWFHNLRPRTRGAVRYVAAAVFTIAFLAGYLLTFGAGFPYLVGLFPVIVCAVLLCTGSGLLSLVLTVAYISRYEAKPQSMLVHSLALLFLVVEGLIVIWIAERRRKAQTQLAAALRQRSRELQALQKAHGRLSHAARSQGQSIEELKKSNKVMLDTLERILDTPS